jgi:hypothetical protein
VTPSELSASPSELSASPSELSASPSELSASPSELFASPSELSASPSELSASPRKVHRAPRNFVQRERVRGPAQRLRRAALAEGAEGAAQGAHVGVVDVAVHRVAHRVAALRAPKCVRGVAHLGFHDKVFAIGGSLGETLPLNLTVQKVANRNAQVWHGATENGP